ncbi:DUF4235 domain-containing protein [Nesterenkonia lutea]|uniref:DUF4235 domain-containing protein n=1 Tax=Nesterenkonia lutea TaxID=272919 RepID=A0ABR9JG06_9MICC|nr:DUF4235 domain-containing protein [Nesterenkonia lutea]MBE1524859.1 hypothetical protein [Nesterenkonia lutea]
MDKLLDKGVALGISLAGGFIATRVFDFVWKKTTGDEAPRVANDEMTLKRALAFSIGSAAVSATVQVLSQRGADSTVKKLRGRLGDRTEV